MKKSRTFQIEIISVDITLFGDTINHDRWGGAWCRFRCGCDKVIGPQPSNKGLLFVTLPKIFILPNCLLQ